MRQVHIFALVLIGAAAASAAVQDQAAAQALQQVVAPAADLPRIRNVRDLVQQGLGAEGQTAQRGARKAFEGAVTAAAIQRAIDDAVQHLRSVQAADGSIHENLVHYSTGAATVMSALAMLAAGADPASDDALRRALDWLKANDQENTYFRAVRANMWEYALRKSPEDASLREALRKDYEWLTQALGDKEGWRYLATSTDWDNSVTQYGVLGVWAACRAGFDPGDAFWMRMSRHFRACQNADGGWGYQSGSSSANMATAGLATMFLVFDMYHGKSFYSAENPRPFGQGEAAACLSSIERGMGWLDKNGGSNQDGYYLYGIERAGVASGRKYIGGRDWFAEGVDVVLRRQEAQGAVPLSGYGNRIVNTGFATLFMVYGGAPVAFNKLEHGQEQDWNLNPRDVANVTKYLWSAYEKPLNWYSVSVDAPVAEFEAPILFISGSKAAAFSDEHAAKLRRYIDRGGTILAEPSDHSAAFRASMVALLRRMYPEKDYPGVRLERLPEDHRLFTVQKQSWKTLPELHGAGDGARTFFLLSDGYCSADWQVNKTAADAFPLAMNLLFYATDLGELKGRFATVVPATPPVRTRDAKAAVARAAWVGRAERPRDWETGIAAWDAFNPYLRHVTGLTVDLKPEAKLTEADLKGVQVLEICGEGVFALTKDERAALKAYVTGGGTAIVSAYAGSEDFAASARSELEALFGKAAPLDNQHVLAVGRFAGGADLSKGLRYSLTARKLLRARGANTQAHQIEAIVVGTRPAVLFSDLDLVAGMGGIANCASAGYKPESARRVMANLIAYACAD